MAEVAPQLGQLRRLGRRPDRRLPPRLPVGRVHGALQRHRPAGDLAAAALDRRGRAGRRPDRRPVRPRGPADPRRRPARAGRALGGPDAARVRWLDVSYDERMAADRRRPHRHGDAVRRGRRGRPRRGGEAGRPPARARLRRAGRRRQHRRGGDARRRRADRPPARRSRRGGGGDPADLRHRHQRHAPLGQPDEGRRRGRRRRDAGRHALLQQAEPGRDAGARRGGRRAPPRSRSSSTTSPRGR